jgi:hypothetical protein
VPHTGSAGLVADRDETKFLIDDDASRRLAAGLDQRLPLLSPAGGARITTVYFDTPDRAILEAARGQGRSVKVRVKEYEHRGSSQEVWLELKLREGQRTGKLRSPIERSRVLEMVAAPDPARGPLFAELAGVRAELDAAVAPACTVTYRRLAWETPDERIRVTIDAAISYAPPPPAPWDAGALASLGPAPVGEFEGGLLELKLRVPPPAWLSDLVDGLALSSSPFSKFVAGSEAVAGG